MAMTWVWCALLLAAAAGQDAGAGEDAPAWRGACSYRVQTTVSLRTPAPAGAGGAVPEVSYRLAGALRVEELPLPPPTALDPLPPHAQFLQFTLQGVELQRRGAAAQATYRARGEPWAGAGAGAGRAALAQAVWARGRLLRFHLARGLPAEAADYLRALVSLFQWRRGAGERAERDVSGACAALYEPLEPTVFRKIKRACSWERAGTEEEAEAEAEAEGEEAEGWEAEGWEARRVSRYTLSAAEAAAPARLYAEEVVWPRGAQWEAGPGLKARSYHELALAAPCEEAPLAAAAAPLPEAPLPLPLPPRAHILLDDDEEPTEDLPSSLERWGAALGGWEAGAGGGAEQARALQPLLRALRGAGAGELRAAVHAPGAPLRGLSRALGLAASARTHQAARALLAPHAPDALADLAEDYFAGLALAPRPDAGVVRDALRLGEEAPLEAVARAALLAGAAAAPRARPAAERPALRARLAAALARCRDPECRALRTAALGNARDPGATGALLAAAERGPGPQAEAALRALRSAALSPAQGARAAALALNSSRPLAERALALELSVERAARGAGAALDAAHILHGLCAERGAGAQELRRALRGRLEALRARPAVAQLLRALPAELRHWDARAAGGTSLVLRRATGWARAARAPWLDATLLAARGVLRRGRVALQSAAGADLLCVEVWTRGLEALSGGGQGAGAGAGAGAEGEEEEEEPGAGLRLSAGGAVVAERVLFSGRAELLAHVWSGAGAAPAGVLRALAGRERAGAAPLQAGAVLRARWSRGAALALDAHGSASLWYRTARAGLALRAAGHARVAGAVGGAGARARLDASAELEAAPRLDIEVDLDFYEAVSLCARVSSAAHEERWRARLRERDARGAATRRRGARAPREGRTLSLGRANDAACRVLRAAAPHT